MDIRKVKNGNQITLFISGTFTFADRIDFHNIILEKTDKEITNIVIDFKNITSMDSSSVGMLLILHEQSQKRGIHVAAINIGRNIRPLFEKSVLGKLFEAQYD